MQEEAILEQQKLLDKELNQRIVDVDTSFVKALNFKIETSQPKPLYKRTLVTQLISSFWTSIVTNSKTLLRGIRPKTV